MTLPYHSRRALTPAHSAVMTPLNATGTKHAPAAPQSFAPWMGTPVILHTAVGELCVPLRGTLIRENGTTLRFRIGEGWDVDIYKSMVLGIEADSTSAIT